MQSLNGYFMTVLFVHESFYLDFTKEKTSIEFLSLYNPEQCYKTLALVVVLTKSQSANKSKCVRLEKKCNAISGKTHKMVADMGKTQENENKSEEFESGRGKQRGHTKGQTNLEHITQPTLWDRTIVPHFPSSSPTVLTISYYSGLLHSPT